MRVDLLTVTVPNWKLLIELDEESPTHRLDDNHIDLRDLGSYLAVFDMGHAINENLLNNRLFSHISFSFYVETDSDIFEDLIQLGTNIKVLHKVAKKKHSYVITATYKEWVDTILEGCKDKIDPDIRRFCNLILNIFSQSKLREYWNQYTMISLPDDTFVLGRNKNANTF